ncbi:MAG: biotin/lipoyl-binding protein, partial [Chloroflexota bacterium]
MRFFRFVPLLMLLLTACSGNNQQIEPTSTPIPTAPAVAPPTYAAQRGDVEDTFEFSGRWLPRDQEPLAFEVGGSARRVNVRRGDTVSAGDLLADLQIDDLENQLASAQLSLQSALTAAEADTQGGAQSVTDAEFSLASANLSLESARNNLPWTSTQSAREQVATAQQQLDDAQRAYDNAVSHPEAPGAANAVDSAYGGLLSARRGLTSAQNSYFSSAQSYNNALESLKGQENAVLQAELRLQEARESAAAGSSDQQVLSAQLQLDQINQQIARSSLYASVDGVVLDVTIAPGDQITAYETVISIGRPEPKEAIATLAFSDAQRLSV